MGVLDSGHSNKSEEKNHYHSGLQSSRAMRSNTSLLVIPLPDGLLVSNLLHSFQIPL